MTRKKETTLITVILSICLIAAIAGVIRSSGNKEEAPETDPSDDKSEAEVTIVLPDSSRGDTADAEVTNLKGDTYNFRIFDQRAGYENYSEYLSAHGCSTCALTTILRTTAEGLEDLTPDRTLTEIIYPVIGDDVFSKNFSKSKKRQMPITLGGMTLIFDKYGVEYKKPSTDSDKRAGEVKKWLRKGNPVILTFGNGKSAHLSRYTHTVLLLGIDDNGKVIIGDSLHKSASYWGKDGLIKSGKLTVEEMLSFIKKEDGWTLNQDTVPQDRIFYKNSADRGYLLIRKAGNN